MFSPCICDFTWQVLLIVSLRQVDCATGLYVIHVFTPAGIITMAQPEVQAQDPMATILPAQVT